MPTVEASTSKTKRVRGPDFGRRSTAFPLSESRRLRGSPFTDFLVSALRGAADRDRDQAITLSEAYNHVYSRTVAASLSGSAGPQHPAQFASYRGSGEWVLSRPTGGGALSVSDPSFGTCYILDQRLT